MQIVLKHAVSWGENVKETLFVFLILCILKGMSSIFQDVLMQI